MITEGNAFYYIKSTNMQFPIITRLLISSLQAICHHIFQCKHFLFADFSRKQAHHPVCDLFLPPHLNLLCVHLSP